MPIIGKIVKEIWSLLFNLHRLIEDQEREREKNIKF